MNAQANLLNLSAQQYSGYGGAGGLSDLLNGANKLKPTPGAIKRRVAREYAAEVRSRNPHMQVKRLVQP